MVSYILINIGSSNVEQDQQHYMGQVMEAQLSCYMVLLSTDSKTRQQDRHTSVMTWLMSSRGNNELSIAYMQQYKFKLCRCIFYWIIHASD